ncbi:MAG TPA: hypothetical protein VGR37_08795, partial [Longimicrobiaceae bacterium]|nr:hypothetical protein [Longimicrobiaceae bacterium]
MPPPGAMIHHTAGRPALRRAALLCAALLACVPTHLAAQRDSATVVAGEHYRAGALHTFLLGHGYRDLWTAPVRVPVLEPDTFAGGLTVLREGGGFSTRSLRMQGADGREYVFRSVDKDVSQGFGPEMRGTLAAWIVQDQVAAKHPAAALAVPPLLDAAGVLHAAPRLFVMPDHPFLGEHRERYAGMLGMLEERPDGGEDGEGGFRGAVRVSGTGRMLELLEESPAHRVASRAFLTARLMDLFLGDWDRHEDQWRWARFDVDGVHLWHPVPRDRDNAFVDHRGVVIAVAREAFPRMIRFRSEYPDVFGLTVHATPLDRRLLAELPRAVWDSTAAALRERLTDEVIDSALARIPPEYRAHREGEMRRILRARRDRLPGVAAEFYAQLASDVDVHATDEPEVAAVDRLEGGVVEVRLYRRDPDTGARAPEPYFRRTFHRGETREVRVYLRGGGDHAVVRGDVGRSVGVRVIGGGGDDVLVDSSRVRGGGGTALYDHRGENRFVAGPGTRVDRRPFREPADSVTLTGVRAYRDWGEEGSDFAPWAGWKSNVGVVVGGGPVATRYGFRREPYARRVWLRGLYAPAIRRFGVEARGDFRSVGSDTRLEAFVRVSDVEVTRFHGFGNETGAEGDQGRYRIGERQLLLAPRLHLRAGEAAGFHLGPVARYTRPRVPPVGP